MAQVELIEMNGELLEGMGSYCLRSKKKTVGYQNKTNGLINNLKRAYITYKCLKIKSK